MSQIREVLSARAETVAEEQETGRRLSQVRGRIRRARRRRAAGAAVATVLVVAAVLGVGTSLGRGLGHGATPVDLADRPVPQTTTSLGYTFGYTDSASGSDGSVSLHLDPATGPRLVRWASASARGQLRLRVSGPSMPLQAPWVSPAGDFSSFVLVPAGGAADVRLEQTGTDDPGEVALAVFTLRDPRPGPTRAGITFREQAPGLRLLGAAIGAEGQGSLGFRYASTRHTDLRLIGTCQGPENRAVEVRVPGVAAYTAGCTTSPFYDAVEGNSATSDTSDEARTGPGDAVVRLVDLRGHPQPAGAGIRIGGAVYADDVAETPEVVEADGHRWRLVATRTSPPGARSLRLRTHGATRELLTWAVPGTKQQMSVRFTAGGHTRAIGSGAGNGGTLNGTYEVSGSGLAEVRMPTPTQRPAHLSVYQLDD